MTSSDFRPPDLEMQVRAVTENGRTRLIYILHSPSGKARFSHQEIPGPVFRGDPGDFHTSLRAKIEQFGKRLDIGGERLLRAELERKLSGLGRQLGRELFSPGLWGAYRRIRKTVRTWVIVSDETWIPWELVKPYDDSQEEVIDDDYLSFQFEMTRWLSGDKIPSLEISVRRLAVIRTDAELPQSEDEQSLLLQLAGRTCVEDVSFSPSSPEELFAFLETGGVDLLHVIGHGTFATQADESAIPLSNGYPFRPNDLEGTIATRIGRDRPLVFLNVCWGGQQGLSLAATSGWASRWVGVCGCGAFIAPLWPVRTQAASEFSRVFYQFLESGETLGQAAQKARLHLRTNRPKGDPSILAYTVYGHPSARVHFGHDAPLPQDRGVQHVPSAIREKIRSFDLLIRRKTEGFVGRQWLFDIIDSFVKREDRGYVQILGDPGIGKTALIAKMVKRYGHLHHFNIRSEGIQNPDQLLPNLCAQLVARFSLGYSTLPLEASRDASFLVRLLEEASAKLASSGQKLRVLVDALDGSDPTAVTCGANTLYLPADLPDGVFFVVTSRRGGPPLRCECAEKRIDLQREAEYNFADARLFAQSWLDRDGIQDYIRNQDLDNATFVDRVVCLSEGNFMYLHCVLPEIEKGTYRERKVDQLPAGLQSYYEDHWMRMREGDPNTWFDYKLPVLVALTMAKKPISLGLITDFPRVKRAARVKEVLAEWAAFLQPCEVEENGQQEIRWRLYHDSFHDFIAAKDQVKDELADLRVTQDKAAAALWKSLYPEG